MDKLKTDEVLTRAETRIAIGYVEGKIGKEIADADGISYNTVVRHTQNIYDKTGIPRSTNALVSWFLSKNYSLDLSELRKAFYSLVMLAIMCHQIVRPDFDNTPLRQFRARRSEVRVARPARGRGRRRKDTINLF